MLHNFTNILNLHTREYKEAAPKVNNKHKKIPCFLQDGIFCKYFIINAFNLLTFAFFHAKIFFS